MPDRGGRPEDAEILELLSSAPIAAAGRVVHASNVVFVLELDTADPGHRGQSMRAIYKPVRGERPLWDFPPNTLHLREAGAYLVDAALDLGLVPPTLLRDGPYGPGSVQLFITRTREHPGPDHQAALTTQLRRLAALDVLLNNADRKAAHILVGDDGRLYGIDNALSFLAHPRQRTVLLDLGGTAMPDDFVEPLRRFATDDARRQGLREHLSPLLASAEVDAFFARVDAVAADPVFPLLDPWNGRPFEWY